MSLTVSIAPASAPAPAARPPRAAAPAAAHPAEGFDLVLGRTADRASLGGGNPRPAGDGESGVEESPGRDEALDLGAGPVGLGLCVRLACHTPETLVCQTPETEVSEVAPVAAIDDRDEEGTQVERDDAAAAMAQTPTPAMPIAAMPPIADASVTAPARVVEARTDSEDIEVSCPTMAAAPDVAASELEQSGNAALTETRSVEEASSAGQPSPAPAAARGAGTVAAQVQARAPRAEARAAAQAIVAEAVSNARGTSPASAPDSGRVATAPIFTSVAPVASGDANPSIVKTRAVQAPVDVLPVETGEVTAPTIAQNQTAGHETAQQQAHDRGQPAGRAGGLAGLPASMVFPGQATFSAAMERALPLAQSFSPGFHEPALETVVPQVVRSMHLQVTAGGGDMKMTLTPEHLGTVTIELRVDQQRVAASLAADTPAVRVWIAAHEQDLKAGLADLGLHLDEFVVRDDDPRERREHGNGPQKQKPPKREKSDQSVFEVQA